MKFSLRSAVTFLCAFAFAGNVATAQDLAAQLSKLGSAAAQGYTAPIMSGWAADMNSAFYHSADLHSILGFDVGLKIALARPTDEDKLYTLTLPSQIITPFGTLNAGADYDQNVTASTAVGSTNTTDVKVKQTSTFIPARGQTILTLPGGFNLPAVPLPVPQLNLGLPFGLEVMARFIPSISAGDAGKFSMTGFGLRYDVDQWLPLFPVDIAVHFMTQSMKFKDTNDKDIFSASATAYGVEVSKGFFLLTLYGGFQLESGSFTIASFTGTNPANPGQAGFTVPGFTIDGKNSSRATVGVRLLLLIINVHAEYSIAKTPVVALGVGISIR